MHPLNLIRKWTRKPSSGPELINQPTFRENDVRYKCTCCTYAKRVIITLDPGGVEQYTCPETRITMRLAPCRPMPYTDPRTGRTEYRDASTYMAGHIILRG